MFKFEKNFEDILLKLAEFSGKIGVPLYFVGGIVRDCLMGIKIKDVDFLVEGSAIDFAQRFKEECKLLREINFEIKSIHKDFDTAKTLINGQDIDFASTREEGYPKSGCLPVVKNIGCPVREDLKRRDFTVNSIAARILAKGGNLFYEIFDPFEGKKDIETKTLKILHKKSYIDDPTRILRGIDFCLRFDFNFSKEDKKLIQESINCPQREGLSFDRVKLTLKKLFSNKNNSKKAFEIILDKKIYKIWQDESNLEKSAGERLFLASEIFNILPSEIFTNAVFTPESPLLFEPAPFKTAQGDKTEQILPQIYYFYKSLSLLETALRWAILGEDEAEFYFKKLREIKPQINGKKLITLGFKEGKTIGDLLTKILEEKLKTPEKQWTLEEEENFILQLHTPNQ